jgi:3-oxoadipate enol-lactonase
MWDSQAALLSRTMRVLRFDNRGHGGSEVPTEPYTIDNLGNDLLTLLDTQGIERAHLCGLSLGGVIAQWCAIHHPERIISVVLANTAARIGSDQMWDARIEAVRTGGIAAIHDAILARFLSEAYRSSHPESTQQISEMLMAIEPAGYIAACVALRAADLRPLISGIRLPTLILGGELDESTPPAQARELHAAIAGSQLVIFPATAHLSNVERSTEFNTCLLEFFKP